MSEQLTPTPESSQSAPLDMPPVKESIQELKDEQGLLKYNSELTFQKLRGLSPTASRAETNEAIANYQKAEAELNSFQEDVWHAHGGEELDQAQKAVDALDFRSDASDHVKAKAELRDAEDAFYAKLQESVRAADEKYRQDKAESAPEPEAAPVGAEDSTPEQETEASPVEVPNPEPEVAAPAETPSPAEESNDTESKKWDKWLERDEASQTEAMPIAGQPEEREAWSTDEEDRDIEKAHKQALKQNKKLDKLDRRRSKITGVPAAAEDNDSENLVDKLRNKFAIKPFVKLKMLFTKGTDGLKERWNNFTPEQKKKYKAVGIGLGALAVAGAATAIWLGLDQPNEHVQNIADTDTGDGYLGRDTPPIYPETHTELPNPSDYSTPWDWATEAFGANDAMSNLHDLADKAAEDGHVVEWHGSGTHEWVEIDGSSAPQKVMETLRQYA